MFDFLMTVRENGPRYRKIRTVLVRIDLEMSNWPSDFPGLNSIQNVQPEVKLRLTESSHTGTRCHSE